MTSIPVIYNQEKYDEWIEQLAEDEVDHLLNEQNLEPEEITYDTVERAVEHSGNLAFQQAELINNYGDILKFGTCEIQSWPTIEDPVDEDLLAVAHEIAHEQIIRDVINETRGQLETKHEIEC